MLISLYFLKCAPACPDPTTRDWPTQPVHINCHFPSPPLPDVRMFDVLGTLVHALFLWLKFLILVTQGPDTRSRFSKWPHLRKCLNTVHRYRDWSNDRLEYVCKSVSEKYETNYVYLIVIKRVHRQGRFSQVGKVGYGYPFADSHFPIVLLRCHHLSFCVFIVLKVNFCTLEYTKH